MQRNMAPEKRIMYPAPASIVRCVITFTGNEADLGILTWTIPNATLVSPNTTHKTINRQFFHSYVDPPHWSANTRQTMDGMKNKVPSGSSRMMCSLSETCCFGFLGDDRKKNRQAKAAPPIGRFI